MKKAIKRFWGIGLIVVLLASLFASPVAVNADDNEWVKQSSPSAMPFYALKANSDVLDIAVYGDGSVVYALANDTRVYKSTNGGVTWSRTNSTALAITPTMIAVAPDDSSRVAVSDGTSVYASVNSGSTFSNLGTVSALNGTDVYNMASMTDLTISPTRLGQNYVTVSGTDNHTTVPAAVFYYNLGAVVGQQWKVIKPAVHAEAVDAVRYSPNFVSDLTMVAVTDNVSGNTVALQVYSFASSSWNPTDFPNYPVTIIGATITAVNRASLVLDPNFLGGEDTLRNSFIGLDTDSTTNEGIYRVLNTTVRNLSYGNIYSLDFDGTTLVAGQQDLISVLRSLDPMSSVPTVTGSASYKSPGGVSGAGVNVVVAFVGANVAAGTTGLNSAYALSRSSGAYFNDVSMIDTDVAVAHDMAVSADGSKIYYVTSDNNTTYTSLWLKTSGWERILSFAYAAPYIVRLAPSNPDVVYLGEIGGTRVYFSKDVQSRWYARTCTQNIVDLAVEADAVAYVLNATGGVVKSSNEGFIWDALPEATKQSTGYSLVSVMENVLLMGSQAGKVSYSLDGNSSWSSISPAIESSGATNVIVIPDEDYANNSKIYAATTAAGKNVQEWTIGTSSEWTDKYTGTLGTDGVYGLAMKGGIIYALTYSTGNSTLRQYIPSVRAWAADTAANYIPSNGIAEPVELGLNTASPNALYASTGSNVLWAIRASAAVDYAAMIFNNTDTLASSAASLSSPPDGTSVNVAANGVIDIVSLNWGRVANATTHTVQVAYDSAFKQTVLNTGFNFPTLNAIIGQGNNGVTLIAGKTYYARVRASVPFNSPWSETVTFTVQPMAAAVPTIGSPENGATIKSQSPAFSWSPVTGTSTYEFQLSTTPTFGTTVLTDQTNSTGTLVPVTIKLEKGKQYFWRVRAIEPIQGEWSAVGNFIVAEDEPTAEPPVTVTNAPPVTVTIPPAPAPTTITIPPAPPADEIAPTYIWAIIIIGAILVIAVIVLIVRTRRSV
jgi:hypothetical protein